MACSHLAICAGFPSSFQELRLIQSHISIALGPSHHGLCMSHSPWSLNKVITHHTQRQCDRQCVSIRCFPPKIIISIPSLGGSITHRSNHVSQKAGMNPLVLQSLTMSAPTSLLCHHLAVLCLVAQSCPTLRNPMCQPRIKPSYSLGRLRPREIDEPIPGGQTLEQKIKH